MDLQDWFGLEERRGEGFTPFAAEELSFFVCMYSFLLGFELASLSLSLSLSLSYYSRSMYVCMYI